jgi:hypothetical protein
MRVGDRERTTAGDKTICLPLPEGGDDEVWIEARAGDRADLDEQIAHHPELFPPEMSPGYWLSGLMTSKRLQMTTRRMVLKRGRYPYPIHPDTVMPLMIGTTDAVEQGLYRRRDEVPYEGIAHVLGKRPIYWYHATQALGRISMVGSPAKDPDAFPPSPGGG